MQFNRIFLTIYAIVFHISVEVKAQNTTTKNLSIQIIEDNGFGCYWNRYAWSMESFNGSLHVGTNNIRGWLATQMFIHLFQWICFQMELRCTRDLVIQLEIGHGKMFNSHQVEVEDVVLTLVQTSDQYLAFYHSDTTLPHAWDAKIISTL